MSTASPFSKTANSSASMADVADDVIATSSAVTKLSRNTCEL